MIYTEIYQILAIIAAYRNGTWIRNTSCYPAFWSGSSRTNLNDRIGQATDGEIIQGHWECHKKVRKKKYQKLSEKIWKFEVQVFRRVDSEQNHKILKSDSK